MLVVGMSIPTKFTLPRFSHLTPELVGVSLGYLNWSGVESQIWGSQVANACESRESQCADMEKTEGVLTGQLREGSAQLLRRPRKGKDAGVLLTAFLTMAPMRANLKLSLPCLWLP